MKPGSICAYSSIMCEKVLADGGDGRATATITRLIVAGSGQVLMMILLLLFTDGLGE